MKRSPHRPVSTALFVAIGIALMLAVEFIRPGGLWQRHEDKQPSPAPPAAMVAEIPPADPAPVIMAEPEDVPALLGPYGPVLDRPQLAEDVAPAEPEQPQAEPPEQPLWRKNAVVAPPVPPGYARVVIVIDDLGMDRRHSHEIIALPGPLTAAFLPYADDVDSMAATARTAGHELMIHMPMEPADSTLNMGAIALHTNMPEADFDAMLERAFASFDGYVGLNNHMGSRLTGDSAAMNRLMTALGRKGLLFLDSKTAGSSVAAQAAKAHHVPHAARDVFLDHDPAYESVVRQLQQLESAARRHGTAIAIGHPKPGTIQALREWLPTLADKNMVLVPVSAVVATETARPHD